MGGRRGSGHRADVVVVGAGPAGTTAALRLLDQGLRPLLVEREQFPRYHIGESMTGECGGLLRAMGLGPRMAERAYPVKHGVCVFGTRGTNDWWVPVMQRRAEGTLEDQVTWQVRRSDFDAMMFDEAVSRGADVLVGRAVAPLVGPDGATVEGVRVRTPQGATVDVHADITLDCSGQATFLAHQGVTGPKYLGSYDKQIAVFSQVTGYRRDGGTERLAQPGNTHIFYRGKYHWAWAIPIDAETTSVGVVVPARYFREAQETRDDFLVRELRELNPGLADRVGEPRLVEPARVIANYSFQVRSFAGPGFVCVGDAHRFVDPIFSFGLFAAVKEAGLAADLAAAYLAGAGRDGRRLFTDHMVATERALDMFEDLIDTFWENPIAFAVFVHHRYSEGIVDLFAGRTYDDGRVTDQRDRALGALRSLLGRDRTYDDHGLYSVPIGSRFHPERAPLWNARLDSVEKTERWIRDRD